MTMMKLADRDIVQGVRKKRITPDDGTTAWRPRRKRVITIMTV